ncbi:hypothetical protein JD969_16380 [Planctomycetota bacterium]|nr:hypothetical protein JD969_16380 [Planctomycetota bacterium]
MAGSIVPLPVMLEDEERKRNEKVELPKSIVVRYGFQKKIAELAYDGATRPGCGSKVVLRTDRGTEVGTLLTTTCPNAGCGSSVSRQQMLDYIEKSGGKEFPFTSKGKVLRIATVEDLNKQSEMDGGKIEAMKQARGFISELELEMKLVDVEYMLGGERVIFYYVAEDWVDFRELVKKLAGAMQTRIEMCQVNSREEARLVADYEKCGQHCCCKQFLKVLKPVSMRAAKVQKATLDPQKISGRCGRLMCCLRYEDKTYSELKKNLPARKSLVETEDGVGVVWDTQILTQLALVKIGINPPTAYPVEQCRVLDKDEAKKWREEEKEREEMKWKEHAKAADRKKSRRFDDKKDDGKGGRSRDGERRSGRRSGASGGKGGESRTRRSRDENKGGKGERSSSTRRDRRDRTERSGGKRNEDKKVSNGYSNNKIEDGGQGEGEGTKPKRRRTRRRRKPGGEGGGTQGGGGERSRRPRNEGGDGNRDGGERKRRPPRGGRRRRGGNDGGGDNKGGDNRDGGNRGGDQGGDKGGGGGGGE